MRLKSFNEMSGGCRLMVSAHHAAVKKQVKLVACKSFPQGRYFPVVFQVMDILHLEQTPGLVVDCRVDFSHGLELVGTLEHVGDVHTSSAGDVLHVKTLVDLRSILHALEDLSGVA